MGVSFQGGRGRCNRLPYMGKEERKRLSVMCRKQEYEVWIVDVWSVSCKAALHCCGTSFLERKLWMEGHLGKTEQGKITEQEK